MENVTKYRDIKLITTERRRNYLVPEPNYHTTKLFTKNVLAMRKTQIPMNKLVYLGLSILDLTKPIMYAFWYDYVKPKHNENMDLDRFIVPVKTSDIYEDIAEDVEARFDSSNYELDRPFS